ncbi:MAG: hypothetical protein EHM62_02020 [Methylococcus sp.]|nr:MAG: hypothetical protein EHM62_02020 [Methylococcus sp.]
MDASEAISQLHQAGFTLAANGDRLSVSPSDRLTDSLRQLIRDHKPDILAALRSPGAILDAGQAGNDIEPANDRVTVHVPELTLSTGQKISCDMTVPRANLERLRAVVRFQLKDGQGGGSVLGSPGTTEDELRDILREKYGARLATINGAAP